MWLITITAAVSLATAAPVSTAHLSWPVQGRVLHRLCSSCEDIEIASTVGAPVTAAADGVVVFTGDDPPAAGGRLLVRHEDGVLGSYSGLAKMTVRVGDRVQGGQILGGICAPEGPYTPRLRFGLRRTDGHGHFEPLDPLALLPRR